MLVLPMTSAPPEPRVCVELQTQLQQRNQQLEQHIASQAALPTVSSPQSVQPPPIPTPTPPPALKAESPHPSPQSYSSETHDKP